ncbi:MAG TPA: sigma-54 dependent transcriptional regulator [Candidatus Polarisedimenticolaceae bacterium]|nr:sigma-54 dependent transcriptional regulator [Candidatus Polarisedimenticolaceae bacterium]
MKTVWIVDDEKNLRVSLGHTLRLEGYFVREAASGTEAVELLGRGEGADLVLLDLQLPGLDGIETLRRLRAQGLDAPVIFLSAHGTIEKAIEAVRLGAFDFLEKPPHADKILLAARNALRQASLEEENRELRGDATAAEEMVGDSAALRELQRAIARVAPTQARVLILGENGSGKELIARALHRLSSRAAGPFARVNCAAIPRELFESELFGHEKGAFTGATARRRGKFARAHGGTLFLDEIGEIPLELQPKLLRALESGEIEPVGADGERRVDVRVLAATNRDLERAVREGRFREDLYFRLQVVTLRAPALRERLEDIPALAAHALQRACADNHLPRRTLSPEALQRLAGYDYPGNVRELRNVIERLVILASGDPIDAAAVERALPLPHAAGTAPAAASTLQQRLATVERQLLLETLERHGWHMTAAAAELGLERSHLYKKLRALGIERPS